MEQRWLPIPRGNGRHHPPLIKTGSVFTEDVCLTSPLLPQCLPHSPQSGLAGHMFLELLGQEERDWQELGQGRGEQEAEDIFPAQALSPDSPSQLEFQTPWFNPFTHPSWPQRTPSCDTPVSQELSLCDL